MDNEPVQKVDIMSYAGKWYSLYSIPTFMDRHWRRTVETYIIHPDAYYAVITTYNVLGREKRELLRSKLFVVRGSGNARMKAQFVWPFKVDYWIIELASDYSYVVVGHPEKKYLFIMARKPHMEQQLLEQITERCAAKGYDTARLVSQEHQGN